MNRSLMDFKKIKYFFIAFLIAGFVFTKNWIIVPYRIRSIIGLILLFVYACGVYALIYRPISSESKLKKYLFLRLGILIFFFLIAVGSIWLLKEQTLGIGAGHILYIVMMVLGYAILTYTIIESLLLYANKKYEQIAINLALALSILCFVVFSGLFGF